MRPDVSESPTDVEDANGGQKASLRVRPPEHLPPSSFTPAHPTRMEVLCLRHVYEPPAHATPSLFTKDLPLDVWFLTLSKLFPLSFVSHRRDRLKGFDLLGRDALLCEAKADQCGRYIQVIAQVRAGGNRRRRKRLVLHSN